jgi:hypothetical protein
VTAIGFTGTRHGMTPQQLRGVRNALLLLQPVSVLHHGDCVGADAQMHELVREIFPATKIHIWPGTDDQHRAFCKGDVEHPRLTPFARNREIVAACYYLIATPQQYADPGRGGTWYTINHARKVKRATLLVQPDGNALSGDRIP